MQFQGVENRCGSECDELLAFLSGGAAGQALGPRAALGEVTNKRVSELDASLRNIRSGLTSAASQIYRKCVMKSVMLPDDEVAPLYCVLAALKVTQPALHEALMTRLATMSNSRAAAANIVGQGPRRRSIPQFLRRHQKDLQRFIMRIENAGAVPDNSVLGGGYLEESDGSVENSIMSVITAAEEESARQAPVAQQQLPQPQPQQQRQLRTPAKKVPEPRAKADDTGMDFELDDSGLAEAISAVVSPVTDRKLQQRSFATPSNVQQRQVRPQPQPVKVQPGPVDPFEVELDDDCLAAAISDIVSPVTDKKLPQGSNSFASPPPPSATAAPPSVQPQAAPQDTGLDFDLDDTGLAEAISEIVTEGSPLKEDSAVPTLNSSAALPEAVQDVQQEEEVPMAVEEAAVEEETSSAAQSAKVDDADDRMIRLPVEEISQEEQEVPMEVEEAAVDTADATEKNNSGDERIVELPAEEEKQQEEEVPMQIEEAAVVAREPPSSSIAHEATEDHSDDRMIRVPVEMVSQEEQEVPMEVEEAAAEEPPQRAEDEDDDRVIRLPEMSDESNSHAEVEVEEEASEPPTGECAEDAVVPADCEDKDAAGAAVVSARQEALIQEGEQHNDNHTSQREPSLASHEHEAAESDSVHSVKSAANDNEQSNGPSPMDFEPLPPAEIIETSGLDADEDDSQMGRSHSFRDPDGYISSSSMSGSDAHRSLNDSFATPDHRAQPSPGVIGRSTTSGFHDSVSRTAMSEARCMDPIIAGDQSTKKLQGGMESSIFPMPRPSPYKAGPPGGNAQREQSPVVFHKPEPAGSAKKVAPMVSQSAERSQSAWFFIDEAHDVTPMGAGIVAPPGTKRTKSSENATAVKTDGSDLAGVGAVLPSPGAPFIPVAIPSTANVAQTPQQAVVSKEQAALAVQPSPVQIAGALFSSGEDGFRHHQLATRQEAVATTEDQEQQQQPPRELSPASNESSIWFTLDDLALSRTSAATNNEASNAEERSRGAAPRPKQSDPRVKKILSKLGPRLTQPIASHEGGAASKTRASASPVLPPVLPPPPPPQQQSSEHSAGVGFLDAASPFLAAMDRGSQDTAGGSGTLIDDEDETIFDLARRRGIINDGFKAGNKPAAGGRSERLRAALANKKTDEEIPELADEVAHPRPGAKPKPSNRRNRTGDASAAAAPPRAAHLSAEDAQALVDAVLPAPELDNSDDDEDAAVPQRRGGRKAGGDNFVHRWTVDSALKALRRRVAGVHSTTSPEDGEEEGGGIIMDDPIEPATVSFSASPLQRSFATGVPAQSSTLWASLMPSKDGGVTSDPSRAACAGGLAQQAPTVQPITTSELRKRLSDFHLRRSISQSQSSPANDDEDDSNAMKRKRMESTGGSGSRQDDSNPSQDEDAVLLSMLEDAERRNGGLDSSSEEDSEAEDTSESDEEDAEEVEGENDVEPSGQSNKSDSRGSTNRQSNKKRRRHGGTSLPKSVLPSRMCCRTCRKLHPPNMVIRNAAVNAPVISTSTETVAEDIPTIPASYGMIECTRCYRWQHVACLDPSQREPVAPFICNRCSMSILGAEQRRRAVDRIRAAAMVSTTPSKAAFTPRPLYNTNVSSSPFSGATPASCNNRNADGKATDLASVFLSRACAFGRADDAQVVDLTWSRSASQPHATPQR